MNTGAIGRFFFGERMDFQNQDKKTWNENEQQ